LAQFIKVGEKKFHKQHFTCCMCDKPLHGQKFHLKENAFYCADDYILKFCHTCRHCKQKISTGSVIQAFGGYYHPEHFVCVVCEQPFKNGKYYESDEQPYCEKHYFALTAEKCEHCRKPVPEGSNSVRVQGKIFHSDCLTCTHCGTFLAQTGSVFQKDGLVYCRNDYLNFFSKRCTACGEHLLNACISVNDEFYHPECLRCSICNKSMDKYICIEGHLRCEEHTDFLTEKFACCVCNELIDENVVRCAGKKAHEECFVCSICGEPAQKATCTLRDDRFCCPNCVMLKDVRKATRASSVSLPSAPAVSKSRRQSTISTGKKGMNGDDMGEETKTPRGSTRRRPPLDEPGVDSKIEWKKGDLIGKGSFGKVYMAMNATTGELIAVKQVRIKTTEEQEQAKEIENEISLMRHLRHKNIVSLIGTQRTSQKLNIIMEYVPGKSLDTLLEKFGAFSEKVMKSYTRQLLHALAYCHDKRVVHRDIKGKNILVDTRGNLKLADFGSAKRFANALSKDSPSLSYNYTPLWTAPEVLVGDYNSKVDIWSLGCVLIEMASAKPPWSEQNFENPFRALYHIGNTNSIPKIPDNVSDQCRNFILCCLRRDPDKRPSAADCLRHPWLAEDEEDEDGYRDESSDEDD